MPTAIRTATGSYSGNIARQVKDLIQSTYQWTYEPVPSVFVMIKNWACLVSDYEINMEFPPLDADLATNGQFQQDFHNNVDNVMDDFSVEDVFAYGGRDAQTDTFVRILKADGPIMYQGATDFVVAMVQDWLVSANQYQQQRVTSATLQMTNDGATADEISAVVNDPLRLRSYIARQRTELIAHLTAIRDATVAADPLNPVTAKEAELLEKHRAWFLDGAADESNYYPNDGAVHYPILMVEIMYMLKEAGFDTPNLIYDAFEMFIKVCYAHMSKQSARDGWNQLSGLTNVVIHGINIAPVISSYVSDASRVIEPQSKLSSPFGRGPLRIMRIAQCLFSCPGPYAILNAPHNQLIKDLIELKAIEVTIKDMTVLTTNVNDGATDLFISTTVAWLCALDRASLFHVVTGRNDQSVPKLVSQVTNSDLFNLDDLTARPWALMHDIVGTDENVISVEEEYFAAPVDIPGAPEPTSDAAPQPAEPNVPESTPRTSDAGATAVPTVSFTGLPSLTDLDIGTQLENAVVATEDVADTGPTPPAADSESGQAPGTLPVATAVDTPQVNEPAGMPPTATLVPIDAAGEASTEPSQTDANLNEQQGNRRRRNKYGRK